LRERRFWGAGHVGSRMTNHAHLYSSPRTNDSRTVPACQGNERPYGLVQDPSLLAQFSNVSTAGAARTSSRRVNQVALTFRLRDLAVPVSKTSVRNIGRFVQENVWILSWLIREMILLVLGLNQLLRSWSFRSQEYAASTLSACVVAIDFAQRQLLQSALGQR